jgi:hypothetical protein
MPKYQYGRDLSSVINVGMFLALIMSEIKQLREPIDLSLMMHNLYETSSLKDKKWTKNAVDENVKNLSQTLSPKIKRINYHITLANKTVKGLDFKHEIPKIKVSDVLHIVRKRLKTIYEVKDAQKMSNEHFHVLLSQTFEKPVTAIQNFIKVVDEEKFTEELVKISEAYMEGLRQALSVCSIGYYSTSVFIAGKTAEEVVNDYFDELFRLKKVDKFDLTTAKFKNKIGMLLGSGKISEELYHRLSNIRIDRNEFGHPSKKILSKKQAHLRIRQIAEVIPEIEKKVSKLRTQKI